MMDLNLCDGTWNYYDVFQHANTMMACLKCVCFMSCDENDDV